MSMLQRILVAICLIAAVSAVHAADIKGSRDHPLIKRYEGCEILHYKHEKFGDFKLALSPVVSEFGKDDTIKKSRKVEGEKTEIFYVCPASRSSLEVYRNYKKDLAALGYKILYEGSGEELGPYYTFATTVFPEELRIHNINPFIRNQVGQRYLAARRVTPEGAIAGYIALYVTEDNEYHSQLGTKKGQPLVKLVVIDSEQMETKMVAVTSSEMSKAIAASGSIALYGILFDTGKAGLKPESDAALEQIADLLKSDADLRLYVVGHTDNVGSYAANVTLSQQRAQAVTKALISRHGIAAARLTPVGVASVAPVTTNKTEDGRAKNRRVQLVEK